MRAALIESLPALAHFFGIRPWEIGRLSMAELSSFTEAAHRLAKRR